MTLDNSPVLDNSTGQKRDIVSEINRLYQRDISLQQQFWIQADIDLRFKAGDQTLWTELYGTMPQYSQKQFSFNRIGRVVNLICGHQRKNRKTLTVIPQENDDQETADQLSGVLQWLLQSNNGYHTISDAFEGAVTVGLNLLCPWIDYSDDPVSGDIKIDRLDFNSFMIDPHFKNPDLSDAAYIMTRNYVSKEQAKVLLPGHDKEIDEMSFTKHRDSKFSFLPENFQFRQDNLCALDWFWYKDTRDCVYLHDEDTGEAVEWNGTEEDLELFLDIHDTLNVMRHKKPTVKLCVLLNGIVMYDGANPWGIDRYPFVGVFGYFEPSIPYFWWRLQGVVRGLRDAQYLYNHKKRIELDILESQINSGMKIKEDALVDMKDAFMSGQGRVLVVKKTASLDDVQTIPPPGIDQSMMILTQTLSQEIMEISGVNEELLGSADDDKAGILSMLRQGAGLTTLQRLFDQLDFSLKELGNVLIQMIQKNFSSGKVKRILGKEPTARFSDKAFGKYDSQIEEGILTATQKQMQFAQLLHLREAGIPIPPATLINAATLQNKADLIKAIEEQQQQEAQMQQQQSQSQQQSQQVLSETLLAKAESDKALASERLNKIHLDKALNIERIAKAQSDRDAATLDRVKAAKELSEMDLNQLFKSVQILKALQEDQIREGANEEEIGQESGIPPQGGYRGVPEAEEIPEGGGEGGQRPSQIPEEIMS